MVRELKAISSKKLKIKIPKAIAYSGAVITVKYQRSETKQRKRGEYNPN